MESSVPKIGAMGGGGGANGVCILHLAAGFLPAPGSWKRISNDEQERSKAQEDGEAYAAARQTMPPQRWPTGLAGAGERTPDFGQKLSLDAIAPKDFIDPFYGSIEKHKAERIPMDTQPNIASPYLTATEAAAYLRTTLQGIYALVKRGRIKPMPGRPGRLLFTREALDRYLNTKP